MQRVAYWLVIAGLLAGCGSSTAERPQVEAPSDADVELARAMCSDLEGGASMFQMHAQAVEFYRGSGRSEDAVQLAAAELEDLATREYCPAFRDEFEATITYEDWIAPDE